MTQLHQSGYSPFGVSPSGDNAQTHEPEEIAPDSSHNSIRKHIVIFYLLEFLHFKLFFRLEKDNKNVLRQSATVYL